jgi:hypothetical protein
MVNQLRQCIRLNQDCADPCLAAGTVGIRRTGSNEQVIAATMQACAVACRACAEECEQHADKHEHCRVVRSTAAAGRSPATRRLGRLAGK